MDFTQFSEYDLLDYLNWKYIAMRAVGTDVTSRGTSQYDTRHVDRHVPAERPADKLLLVGE